jgi:FKBP-type peptidyl-prolyl cis-trans isomerase
MIFLASINRQTTQLVADSKTSVGYRDYLMNDKVFVKGMKKIIASFLLVISGVSLCAQQHKEIVENGAKYRIIKDKTEGRAANGDSTLVLYMNYKLAIESTDSTIAETFSKNSPVYIPVNEPNFHSAFKLLSVGDSAEVIINVDTFFEKSFGQSRPAFAKEGDNIKFTVKVLDIMSQQEVLAKAQEDIAKLQQTDSLEFKQLIASLPNAKSTASGLYYVVEKKGKGKAAKKGDKVQVLYKGTLLNGQVFDENLTEGISFTVGLGQFIPGWEEMLQLMKVGDKVKAIIPWNLGYGPRGNGPIPPFSTLVFEMELVKVN